MVIPNPELLPFFGSFVHCFTSEFTVQYARKFILVCDKGSCRWGLVRFLKEALGLSEDWL